MAPNTEFGTDNRPKGFARTHLGYLQHREDSDDQWVYAVRLQEIRQETIDHAAQQGTYQLPPRAGAGLDVTSFLESIQNFGPERADRPEILFQLRKTAGPSPVPANMIVNKQVVLDQNDHRIRHFPELPLTLSTFLEGHHIEYFMRLNDQIDYTDLIARMPAPTPSVITLKRRARSFRYSAGCLAWSTSPEYQATNAHIENLLGPDCVSQNSSRPFGRDFTVEQQNTLLGGAVQSGPLDKQTKGQAQPKSPQTDSDDENDEDKKDNQGDAIMADPASIKIPRNPTYSSTFSMTTRTGRKAAKVNIYAPATPLEGAKQSKHLPKTPEEQEQSKSLQTESDNENDEDRKDNDGDTIIADPTSIKTPRTPAYSSTFTMTTRTGKKAANVTTYSPATPTKVTKPSTKTPKTPTKPTKKSSMPLPRRPARSSKARPTNIDNTEANEEGDSQDPPNDPSVLTEVERRQIRNRAEHRRANDPYYQLVRREQQNTAAGQQPSTRPPGQHRARTIISPDWDPQQQIYRSSGNAVAPNFDVVPNDSGFTPNVRNWADNLFLPASTQVLLRGLSLVREQEERHDMQVSVEDFEREQQLEYNQAAEQASSSLQVDYQPAAEQASGSHQVDDQPAAEQAIGSHQVDDQPAAEATQPPNPFEGVPEVPNPFQGLQDPQEWNKPPADDLGEPMREDEFDSHYSQ